MKLPNWFKIAYWISLTGFVSWLLFYRLDVTTTGRATPFDAVVFVVWLALLLAPLFSEIQIWGISLKQEIEKARKETADAKETILREVQSIRMDVRNSINISPVINHTVQAPPPDSQLPRLKEDIERSLPRDATGIRGEELPRIPSDVEYLFAVRYQLEQQVRRIAAAVQDNTRLRGSLSSQIRFLMEQGAISQEVAKATIDVYRVCSPAVHGDVVSDAQIAFVRDVATQLIENLSLIPPLLPD